MNELIFASMPNTFVNELKDVALWGSVYNVISPNVCVIDRCDYIKMPFNFRTVLKMPTKASLFDFNKTYYDICIERATELLQLSRKLNKPITILYSGGIDSTVVLISFIIASNGDHSNIKVALNTHSIRENPNFYYDHIRGNFDLFPSEQALDTITSEHLIVGGEGNDQIFGTDIYKDLRNYIGIPALQERYTEKNITDYFKHKGMSDAESKIWFSLMDSQIKATNYCEIKTIKDFFWWYNFCYKWQNVYFRIPARSTSSETMSKDFLDQYYHQFFITDDFQRWSLLNPDKKIGSTWASYKIAAKEMIYNFTKDQEYFDNKTKVPSLVNIVRQRFPADAISTDYTLLNSIDPMDYYNPNNSFVA